MAMTYAKLHRFGFPLVFLLLIVIPWMIPSFNPLAWLLMPPFEWLTGHYLSLAGTVAGH